MGMWHTTQGIKNSITHFTSQFENILNCLNISNAENWKGWGDRLITDEENCETFTHSQ